MAGMNRRSPYYDMIPEVQSIVVELIKTCEHIYLDNVHFEFRPYPESHQGATASLCRLKEYWELVIGIKPYNESHHRDIYKVANGEFTFDYTEWD